MAILGVYKSKSGAGQLDRRILIESYTASRDTLGGEVITWASFAEVWAGVEYRQAVSDETQQAAKQTANRVAIFKIRYLTGVTEKMRITFDSEYYDILSITEEGRRVFLSIEAERRK